MSPARRWASRLPVQRRSPSRARRTRPTPVAAAAHRARLRERPTLGCCLPASCSQVWSDAAARETRDPAASPAARAVCGVRYASAARASVAGLRLERGAGCIRPAAIGGSDRGAARHRSAERRAERSRQRVRARPPLRSHAGARGQTHAPRLRTRSSPRRRALRAAGRFGKRPIATLPNGFAASVALGTTWMNDSSSRPVRCSARVMCAATTRPSRSARAAFGTHRDARRRSRRRATPSLPQTGHPSGPQASPSAAASCSSGCSAATRVNTDSNTSAG